MILEFPSIGHSDARVRIGGCHCGCVAPRARPNVPRYTTHPVCGRSVGRSSEAERAAAAPSVGQDSGPGEERHEIGILMDCAILLAEIKAGALSLGSL